MKNFTGELLPLTITLQTGKVLNSRISVATGLWPVNRRAGNSGTAHRAVATA